MAGTAGRCTVIIGDLECERTNPALEIRTDRGRQDAELVFFRRLYADDGARTENIRTDIKRRTGAVGRNIVGICEDYFTDSFDKTILRENGDLQPPGGILETLSVEVRTESDNTAVLCRVGLQTFKDSLCILQDSKTVCAYCRTPAHSEMVTV